MGYVSKEALKEELIATIPVNYYKRIYTKTQYECIYSRKAEKEK